MKTQFKQILKEYGKEYEYSSKGHSVQSIKSQKQIENEKKSAFFDSVMGYTKDAKEYKMSDISRIYEYIAKYRGHNNIKMHESSFENRTS